MESQDGPSLLEVLMVVFAAAVLILYSTQYVPATVWLLAFVGFAHLCLFLAIAMPLEPHSEDSKPADRRTARTDIGLLTAVTVLPTSMSIMMLTHHDIDSFALANAFYLLSLAFAVWATMTAPICAGDAYKVACLAQVVSYIVSASVHIHILDMPSYSLQKALAVLSAGHSNVVHLILILIFLRRSLQGQHTPNNPIF